MSIEYWQSYHSISPAFIISESSPAVLASSADGNLRMFPSASTPGVIFAPYLFFTALLLCNRLCLYNFFCPLSGFHLKRTECNALQPIIEIPDKGLLCVGTPCPISVSGGQGDVEWYAKSAPGDIQFAPATAPSTTVTVNAPGNYVICARYVLDLPDTGMCAFTPFQLNGACPSGVDPTYVEWSAVPPFQSAPIIFSPNQISTFVMATAPGTYVFELKCYHYGDLGLNPGTNIESNPAPIYPAPPDSFNTFGNVLLSCPMAIVAGQSAQLVLVGCEGQNVEWTITTPTTGTTTQNGTTSALIGTSLIDSGTVVVDVECTDPVTGAVSGTDTCTIPIIDFDPLAGIFCETITYQETFDNCGIVCTSTAESLTFIDCDAVRCTETYLTIRVAELCNG